MAIFNNSNVTNQSNNTDSSTTIITTGAKIKGELDLNCNLYIDGELEGSLKSSKEINVGKHGYIKGDITTHRLIVQGHVEGSVNADKVEIKAAGRVSGEITSVELVIESKAIFEGSSIVKDITKSTIIDTKEELSKS